MNTPTHLLVGAAAFGRSGRPATTAAALLGGLAPDFSLYVMVGWERFANGRSFEQIFDEDYFSDFWQTVFAVDNSAPLYGLLALCALAASGFSPRRVLADGRWTAPLFAFAGAALLHIALDLPLHHDDGRAHFWPFSDWVFQSPVSYWDHRRYGDVVGVAEGALVLALCALLWFRFRSVWARVTLALAAGAQALAAGMWAFLLG